MSEQVNVLIALENIRKFVADAQKAAKSMGLIGASSEKAGKQAGSAWKTVAKWAGGAALFYGVQRMLRSTISATEDLAKSTLALQRQTNLDTKTASEWVGVLRERNIQVRTFQVGLKTLSKQMYAATNGAAAAQKKIAGLRGEIDQVAGSGSKNAPAQLAKLSAQILKAQQGSGKAADMFKQMGISMDAIKKGDTQEVMLEMADALSKQRNATLRSVWATTLLGRSGTMLLPLFMMGRKGIEEQLGIMDKYHAYLTGKTQKDTMEQVYRQRELNAAMTGMKIQLGEALMPVLFLFTKALLTIMTVLQPLTKRTWLWQAVIIAVTTALIALKVAVIRTAYAQGEATMATKAYAVVMWAWNYVTQVVTVGIFMLRNAMVALDIALDANIIGVVVIALIALGVAAYEAYKHWDTLKKFIARNWMYIAAAIGAPFALLPIAIYKNFDAIKRYMSKFVGWVKSLFSNLFSWIKHLPGKAIGGVLDKIPGVGTAQKILGAFADGGVAGAAGRYLVGERGPEIVTLPRSAQVTPALVQPLMAGGPQRGAGRPIEITVPLVVDGRELARAMARVTADRIARR